MPRGIRHALAVFVIFVATGAGAVSLGVTRQVGAIDAAWTLPTVPPKCSSAKLITGDVTGCVVMGGTGLPESQGWPTPPFPVAGDGSSTAWVNLAVGSTGEVVRKVQQALSAAGYTLSADGQFGPLTEAKVKLYQTDQALPSTGVVDQATADALGVTASTPAGTFPPAGWLWSGWGYNGSPALADWELKLAPNLAPMGSVKSGQMRMMSEALPLFTGFISEIVAGGYKIGDLGGYVFRCTASTNKSCSGLTRAALSNHAYGLAIDFNTAANPMATNYGINGASACQTPMQTDIPQWVVQTAEKWGLYWGGYGWSSGCSSPAQVKSSASRDPMHFEFRGTVAQANTILQYNLAHNPAAVPVNTPCVPMLTDQGATMRCLNADEVPPAGSRLKVSAGAPAGAAAALVNVTLTGAAAAGFATAEQCGPTNAKRQWSNANTVPGKTVANLAVVPLDAQGSFCLYLSSSMHAVVDVQGFFATAANAPGGSLFTPVEASRVVDSRINAVCAPSGSCQSVGPIAGEGELVVGVDDVPATAQAVLMNLTVTEPAAAGYLTADKCSALEPGPQTSSNVNYAKGSTVANLAVVPADPAPAGSTGVQVCTYSIAATHQVVDVQGYFAPDVPGGLGYTAATPQRMVDTRECWTNAITSQQQCAKVNAAGSVMAIRAPVGAEAVLVNLTLTAAPPFLPRRRGPRTPTSVRQARPPTSPSYPWVPTACSASTCRWPRTWWLTCRAYSRPLASFDSAQSPLPDNSTRASQGPDGRSQRS